MQRIIAARVIAGVVIVGDCETLGDATPVGSIAFASGNALWMSDLRVGGSSVSGQGIERTTRGPSAFVNHSGQRFHSSIADLNFGFFGL